MSLPGGFSDWFLSKLTSLLAKITSDKRFLEKESIEMYLMVILREIVHEKLTK
jgi:hypothetical protein